jgi:hypothetical protein
VLPPPLVIVADIEALFSCGDRVCWIHPPTELARRERRPEAAQERGHSRGEACAAGDLLGHPIPAQSEQPSGVTAMTADPAELVAPAVDRAILQDGVGGSQCDGSAESRMRSIRPDSTVT